jgi:hypothetical protein
LQRRFFEQIHNTDSNTADKRKGIFMKTAGAFFSGNDGGQGALLEQLYCQYIGKPVEYE